MKPNRDAGLVLRRAAENRRKREAYQGALISDDICFKETIRAKLDGRFQTNQFVNFSRCGEEQIYRTCRDCGTVEKFTYKCCLKWCPVCSWKLVKKRQQLLRLWAAKIKHPKHLVLTQKNFPILTRKELRRHTKALATFRRSVCFKDVAGGSVSVEITNEDRGWHLHSHWLLDVPWLDIGEVAKTWARIVGQEFAIVKIKDVAGQDYQYEVTKYVTEGSAMAKWQPEHILEFVTAIKGRRFFFTFGNLRNFAKQVKEELEFLKPDQVKCDCGCGEFTFEDEQQVILNECRKRKWK